ncbi:maleylpyruvate isomerase family mycothiol-dependent enzyme [Gordonia sp. TBRC 11910]|uniref:Maleylpyruvate isomerase family mycothiol-dependent enzyme n=1 Tax=Gordonia asplenii TaxID=2725283 RepID=A0A848L4Y9_9ACTN|nr:maleylpyruvate isomerase family mycothiol-dependent enzyme [Gordonia asplenii]NMO02678.1 maleylpyruvate isomerase family mycothiol-dependent enzyme [Gordonia asplenii]
MRATTSETWRIVHDERLRLVDDLAHMRDEAWQTPSLCPGWTVHDVLAHLVDSATTTRIGFVRRMIAAGFDFDCDNARGVERNRSADPADTLDAMRRAASLTCTPPAALATRLVEAFVHGEDIRRPLGIAQRYPQQAVVDALTYQLKTSVTMGGGRQRADGVRLIATDVDFTHGSGAEVRGRAIDLLLAVSGRAVLPNIPS